MKKPKTKRGNTDHETLILHDLKGILENIFDLKGFEKRTINRHDITYDSFITIDRLKPDLKGHEFFDFLFEKKVLIAEVKTPGQYFDIRTMAQVEDINASYLNYLDSKNKLKEEELEQIIILTVITSISKKFLISCRKNEILIKPVKKKKGLYIIRRLIPVYLIVIDELEYDEAYVQLLKYTKDLKRLVSIIKKMKDGMKKEKFVKIALSFVDYNPKILATERSIKDMIPVFTDEKDRIEYMKSFLEGFGRENVIKLFNPKEVLGNYNPKERLEGLKVEERLEGLKVEERLEGLKVEERLEGLKVEERLKGLSKKDREKLKNILMDT